MTRLAVFGGTFDPVHQGHLLPARAACAAFGFDAVLFVPAGTPPHKLGEPRTAFAHRFAMLALATQDDERFLVSDIELERTGPSYTVDTLRVVHERHADAELYFLMGSDSLAQISTWHRWDMLLELAHLVVLHREPDWGDTLLASVPEPLRRHLFPASEHDSPQRPDARGHRIYILGHAPCAVSATDVRERAGRGDRLDDLVPPAVSRYIAKHGLYLGGRGASDGR